MANKIPLREIHKAISINAAIDEQSSKVLTLRKRYRGLNQGIPRCVFMYIALKCSYTPEEICDYLSITSQEFAAKEAVLQDLYTRGHKIFTTSDHSDYSETVNTAVIFYRKLLLAQNYLRYRCGYEP